MSSNHKLYKCLDCDNTTTKTWCKPCGYKNRKIEIWNKGKQLPPEMKLKISKSKKGVSNPKHSEWMKAHHHKYWLGKKRIELRGDNNVMWRGASVGYRALHKWVEVRLGKPSKCEHCSTTTAKRFEWANKSHEYKREVSDWLRLCTKCHRAYDRIEVNH